MAEFHSSFVLTSTASRLYIWWPVKLTSDIYRSSYYNPPLTQAPNILKLSVWDWQQLRSLEKAIRNLHVYNDAQVTIGFHSINRTDNPAIFNLCTRWRTLCLYTLKMSKKITKIPDIWRKIRNTILTSL